MAGILVLYEDSRTSKAGDLETFAFHERFVLTLVGEQLKPPVYPEQLKRKVIGWPMNGNSAVTELLKSNDGRLGAFKSVLAVLDDDKVRKLLPTSAAGPKPRSKSAKTSAKASVVCKGVVVQAIRSMRSPQLDKHDVVLLVDNLESVLLDIFGVMGPVLPPGELQRALNKKPSAREFVFLSASKAEHRALRVQVLARNPSLKRLVDRLVRLLS
jgi:hypothetical protein